MREDFTNPTRLLEWLFSNLVMPINVILAKGVLGGYFDSRRFNRKDRLYKV